MTRKTTLPSLLVVLGLSLAACAGGPAGGRPGVERIALGPSGGRVPVGAAVSFRAVALDAEGVPVEGVTFDWRSGDPAVLSIDAGGRAVARAAGTTTVSASAYGLTGLATLEVTPASTAPAAVDWAQARPTRYPPIQDLEAAAGTLYLLTGEGRLYLSTGEAADAGRRWRPVQAGNFEGCTELSTHPEAPGALLAVCEGSELRRSSNGGRYWETVLTAADPGAPVFHPHDPDVVHAGPYRSEDGGESWTRLEAQGVLHPGGSDREVIYDIANHPGPVFGTTVRISHDGGESWQGLGYPAQPLHCETPVTWRRAVAAESGKLLLVASQDCPDELGDRIWFGTYVSTDGGSSWTLTGSASGSTRDQAPYAYPHWRFAPGSDTVLFVTGDSIDGTSPLYRSRDGVATWQTFAAEPALSPTLRFAPARPELVLATGLHDDAAGHYEVYRWLEEEATWRDTGAEVRAPLGLKLVHESGTYFFERGAQAALEGLWFTADAFSSSTRDGMNRGLDAGLPGGTAQARAVDRGDGDRLLVGRLATRDAGESWQAYAAMPPGLGALAQAPSLHRRWYYASEGGHLHISDDGGETLAWQGRIPNHGAGETPLDLVVSFEDPALLYALSPAGVHRSADAGASWQWAASGVGYPGAELALDPADDQTLYLATQGGVYLSHDGSRSWQPANQGLANLATTALAIGADGATLYTGTSHGGPYRSLDGGGTWEAINTGLASSRVIDVATHPTDPDVVYLATLGGVYASTDKGSSWLLASRGLYSPLVDWLELSADGERLYLMTRNNGIYRGAPSEEAGAGFAIQDVEGPGGRAGE